LGASTTNHLVVAQDVSNQPVDVYFSSIHPVWPIIYKPLFDRADHESLAKSLSQPVVYAIYAIAACLKPDIEIPPPSLFFEAALLSIQRTGTEARLWDRTNSILSTYYDHLSRTARHLQILALQQHEYAERSNAFMLCSLASAIVIELGLQVARSPNQDPIAVQVSSRIWWNLFVLEKVIACKLGRPMSLRSEDSNTPFPSTTESDEYQLLQFRLPDAVSPATIKSHTLSGFQATINLTKIMEKVARQLYLVESCMLFEQTYPRQNNFG